MSKIGAFEAKTHLSSLSDKVTQGEDVLVTSAASRSLGSYPRGKPNG